MPDEQTKTTRHARILDKLCAFRIRFNLTWVSNGDLMQPDAGGGDWRRRIHELRERGHVIVMRRDKLNAHRTLWTWLGVEFGSVASEAIAEAENFDQAMATTPRVVARPFALRDGRDVWRYTTSDRFVMLVEKVHTAGGGTMLVEHVNEADNHRTTV